MKKTGTILSIFISAILIVASIVLCFICYGTVSPKEIITENIDSFVNQIFNDNTYELETYSGKIPQNYTDCEKAMCTYKGEKITYIKYYYTDSSPFEYNVWYDKVKTDGFKPYYDDKDAYTPQYTDEIKTFADWCADAFESDENHKGIEYDFDKVYEQKDGDYSCFFTGGTPQILYYFDSNSKILYYIKEAS